MRQKMGTQRNAHWPVCTGDEPHSRGIVRGKLWFARQLHIVGGGHGEERGAGGKQMQGSLAGRGGRGAGLGRSLALAGVMTFSTLVYRSRGSPGCLPSRDLTRCASVFVGALQKPEKGTVRLNGHRRCRSLAGICAGKNRPASFLHDFVDFRRQRDYAQICRIIMTSIRSRVYSTA